jgi:hypothetical protein
VAVTLAFLHTADKLCLFGVAVLPVSMGIKLRQGADKLPVAVAIFVVSVDNIVRHGLGIANYTVAALHNAHYHSLSAVIHMLMADDRRQSAAQLSALIIAGLAVAVLLQLLTGAGKLPVPVIAVGAMAVGIQLRQGADKLPALVIAIFVVAVDNIVHSLPGIADYPLHLGAAGVAFLGVSVLLNAAIGLVGQGQGRQYQGIGSAEHHHGHQAADHL